MKSYRPFFVMRGSAEPGGQSRRGLWVRSTTKAFSEVQLCICAYTTKSGFSEIHAVHVEFIPGCLKIW